MKCLLHNALLASLLLIPQVTLAESFKLDAAHSRFGFKIKHLGISSVRGEFREGAGTADYDTKTKKLGPLKATIAVKSIYTNDADRDKHLLSADFFDVEKFPSIEFSSTKVLEKGGKPTEILGVLTMHGVSKDIRLKVSNWGGFATDPWGNEKFGFEASGTIDRRDFGLTWNKGLAKAGETILSNDVVLELELEGSKQTAK